MATNTSKYGFKKPEENDFYSIEDQNRNWDLADGAIGQLNNDLSALMSTTAWTKKFEFVSDTHSGGLYLIILSGGGGSSDVDYICIASTASGYIRVQKIVGGSGISFSTSQLTATFTATNENFIATVLRLRR